MIGDGSGAGAKERAGSLGASTALLKGSGSQSCLLNASLRGTQRELCPNGFLTLEGEGGRTRLGESLERIGRLGKSRRWG